MLRRLQFAILSSCLFVAGIVGLYALLTVLQNGSSENSSLESPALHENREQQTWQDQIEELRGPASTKNMTEEDLDIGEDPNLAMPSDRTQTQADFCYNCNTSYSAEVTHKNYKSIRDISLDLPNEPHQAVVDPSNPIWSQFPDVMSYAEHPRTIEAINQALKNKKPRPTQASFQSVRSALGEDRTQEKPTSQKRQAATEAGPEISKEPKAADAEREIKGQGFINLLDDPQYKDFIQRPGDAPKGAVLIYENTKTPSQSGHIEIKTDWGDSGGYISDFLREGHNQMSGSKLIGVMIRPQKVSP